MNAENQAPTTRPNRLVFAFVAGLPLGLVVMGALSFIFYFQKRHQRETAQPSRFAAVMRKDVRMEDFVRYQHVFTDIGECTMGKPENLEIAASFIESTLGFDNMGYSPVMRDFELGGKKYAHIEVELKGTSDTGHLVLVVARYDGSNTRAVAALLCLANALTGTRHSNTIRFVAMAAGDDGAGVVRYKDWIDRTKFQTISVLLNQSVSSASIENALKSNGVSFIPLPLSSPTTLDDLKHCEAALKSAADAR